MKTLLCILTLLASNVFAMDITATSWLVADGEGRIIQSESPDRSRSIASITKLMTVMVVVDAGQNPKQVINGLTREQHIQLALVHSSNESATILCNNYPGGRIQCIRDMNSKAVAIGMNNTRFIEPTGLSPMNTSTAKDLLQLVLSASYYPNIREASNTTQVKIKLRRKWFFANNTNPIIGKRHEFIVSKTGWTNIAGGCIVMMLNTDIGKRVVVVLGSKDTHTRIPEAEFIATYNDRIF